MLSAYRITLGDTVRPEVREHVEVLAQTSAMALRWIHCLRAQGFIARTRYCSFCCSIPRET
jgi:hypothetical protein